MAARKKRAVPKVPKVPGRGAAKLAKPPLPPPGFIVRPWDKPCELKAVCGYLTELSNYLVDFHKWLHYYFDIPGGDKTGPPPPPTFP